MKIALVQMSMTENTEANLKKSLEFIEKAAAEGAAKPTTSAQGISLTVKKFVPKPEQPVTPKQVIQKGIKTGDTTPIALYVILAAAAVGAAVVLIKHRPARH
jgi:hypothetical protein